MTRGAAARGVGPASVVALCSPRSRAHSRRPPRCRRPRRSSPRRAAGRAARRRLRTCGKVDVDPADDVKQQWTPLGTGVGVGGFPTSDRSRAG